MTGERHGRLVALECAHRDSSGHAHWRFACDCGAQTVAHGGNVRAGRTTSCGCFHRETSAARLTVHGARAGRRHGPTYRAWQQMNDACENAASPGFARAGARGIGVAVRWRGDYAAFLADLGERPAGTALARIDPARDFAPGNCRWAPLADRAARAAAGWRERQARAAADAATVPDARGRTETRGCWRRLTVGYLLRGCSTLGMNEVTAGIDEAYVRRDAAASFNETPSWN